MRRGIRQHSSIFSGFGFASRSSSFPTNPVSLGRHRSRRRRLRRAQQRQKSIIVILIAIVICFGLIDLYYLFDVTKQHKLSEIKPALRMQGEKVKQVLKEEREEISEFLLSEEGVDNDKEEIFNILEQAGVHKSELDKRTRQKLPTWTTVQETYGTFPKIFGLDRCVDYRKNVDPSQRLMAIAGPFNSGTNLLAELLIKNCQIKERMQVLGGGQRGVRWQVPWGKHTPVQYREQHVIDGNRDIALQNVLPVVAIRDPYRWMRSMCNNKYEAHWNHNETACPNVWDEYEPNPVTVKYADTVVKHNSLPDFWNDWYNEYIKVDFPRIIVRYEDLLFYGKDVIDTLCKCGGGEPRTSSFVHAKETAKWGEGVHGVHKTDLLSALIQYGSNDGRTRGMNALDITHSGDLLDPTLMKKFSYEFADDS